MDSRLRMPEHTYDLAQGAARADLCRYLAACYYEPTPAFAEERMFAALLAAAQSLGDEYATSARRLGEAFADTALPELLVDYTRLFIGPLGTLARPYGSVWLGGDVTLMQDSSVAVQALYEEGGFAIDEAFRELPDHVAAELEFLYLLIHQQNVAQARSELDAVHANADLRRRFLDAHLGRWAPAFARAVEEGAQTPFYRELAALTARFVAAETAAART